MTLTLVNGCFLASITRAGANKHTNAATRCWEVLQQRPSGSAGLPTTNAATRRWEVFQQHLGGSAVPTTNAATRRWEVVQRHPSGSAGSPSTNATTRCWEVFQQHLSGSAGFPPANAATWRWEADSLLKNCRTLPGKPSLHCDVGVWGFCRGRIVGDVQAGEREVFCDGFDQ